jgi:hypothetical protein
MPRVVSGFHSHQFLSYKFNFEKLAIFIFACGDKFYLPRDQLVFLNGEISLDAPPTSLVLQLFRCTWNPHTFLVTLCSFLYVEESRR